MKPISYMLDSASGRPDESTAGREPAPFRRIAPFRRTGPAEPEKVTVQVQLPAIGLDVDACAAFDRRPPLEAMTRLWLRRSNVVTVYDCGHDTRATGSVYDAVFRLQSYVWIRSPAPVLKDDLLDF